MAIPRNQAPAPRGIAFSIAEHRQIRSWADNQNLRVVAELDRIICGDEYEEVLAFYQPCTAWRRLTLWRRADGFVLEPATGATRYFPDINDATRVATALLDPAATPHLARSFIR